MGIMSQLQSRQSAPVSSSAAAASPTVSQSSANQPSACTERPQAIPVPTWPSTWPTPAPCPVCGSPGYWVDVYGGGPHCRGCSPPSSPTLAAYAVWVVDGDDGSAAGRRWVRNPRAEDEPSHSLAGHVDDGGEWVTWQLPNGTIATALRERVDHTRRANARGLHQPALACGPVGDLAFDDWFERLPELPAA